MWWFSSKKWIIFFTICELVITVDNMHFVNVNVNVNNESPCPDIFEYGYDERNELFGKILIRNPSRNVVTLNVELSVGNSVHGYNGNIHLGYSRTKTIDDILRGRPLLYKISFPTWQRFPPKITKIILNGELICSGPPLNIKIVPVLTTINLQHTLKINVSPNPLDQPISENNFQQISDFISNNNANQPKDPSYEYPQNPFFQPTTQRSTSFEVVQPTSSSFNPNPNQIITFVVPPSTRGTTQKPFVDPPAVSVQPIQSTPEDIDVRSDIEEVCGKSLASNYLISYGNPITRGHHPWLAALYVIQNLGLIFICGGNLISTQHVLTAAHCLRRNGRRINVDDLLVILGKHNIQQWIDNESEMLYAKDIVLHPDYKDLAADADIAMITLTKEVQFKRFIRPICLWSEPTDLNLIVGEKGIVAGWGKDENGVQTSAEAKQVVLPIVTQEKCIRSQETFAELVSERTFCAGYRNGSGPCNGDSGGGFIMQRGGRWTLRGLVSLSLFDTSKVCDLSQYLLFTDVSKFSTWIRSFLLK